MEAVPNSRLERERARIMTLSFHVSDNTLRVYEPPQESSGLYQVSVRGKEAHKRVTSNHPLAVLFFE